MRLETLLLLSLLIALYFSLFATSLGSCMASQLSGKISNHVAGRRLLPSLAKQARKSATSIAYLARHHALKSAKESELERALVICREQECAGKKAVSLLNQEEGGGLQFLTARVVDYALKKEKQKEEQQKSKGVASIDHDKRYILTQEERRELALWARAKADVNEPAQRPEISRQARSILLIRQKKSLSSSLLSNQRPQLAPKEKAFLASNASLSSEWFNRWYEENGDIIQRRSVRRMESRRMSNYNEGTVTDHFSALEITLINAGIMDPKTKLFDANRLFNMDETPEFFWFPGATHGRKQQVMGSSDRPAFKGQVENRETFTVNMTASAGGLLLGPHLIFNQSGAEEGAIPCAAVLTEKDWEEIGLSNPFTNKIDKQRSQSTYLLMSATPCGIQSEQTLIARLDLMLKELRELGVILPVCLMMDNHDSRLDIAVVEWQKKHAEEIVIHLEKSGTSTLFQPLDQVNKDWHAYSNKVKESMMREYSDSNGGEEKTFAVKEVMLAFGKSWFEWITTERIRSAFRRVGISPGDGSNKIGRAHLSPDNLNRDGFWDRPATQEGIFFRSPPALVGIEEADGEDEEEVVGTRSNVADLVKENARLKEHVRDWRDFFLKSPAMAGALAKPLPPVKKTRTTKKRVNQHAGGATLTELAPIIEQQNAKKEQDAVEKATRKEDRKRKQDVKLQTELELEQRFNQCRLGCVCEGIVPCDASKMKQCQWCGEIKMRKCAKASCKKGVDTVKPRPALPPLLGPGQRVKGGVKMVLDDDEEDDLDASQSSHKFSSLTLMRDTFAPAPLLSPQKKKARGDRAKFVFGNDGQAYPLFFSNTTLANERKAILSAAESKRLSAILYRGGAGDEDIVSTLNFFAMNKTRNVKAKTFDITIRSFERLQAVGSDRAEDYSLWLCCGIFDALFILLRGREAAKKRLMPLHVIPYLGAPHLMQRIHGHFAREKDAKGLEPTLKWLQIAPFSKRLIILVVNVSNSHWAELYVHPAEKLVQGANSLPGSLGALFPSILWWLGLEANIAKKRDFEASEWRYEDLECNRQENSVDCGMFSICRIRAALDNTRCYLTQKDIPRQRDRLALELLDGRISGAIATTEADMRQAALDNRDLALQDGPQHEIAAPLDSAIVIDLEGDEEKESAGPESDGEAMETDS